MELSRFLSVLDALPPPEDILSLPRIQIPFHELTKASQTQGKRLCPTAEKLMTIIKRINDPNVTVTYPKILHKRSNQLAFIPLFYEIPIDIYYSNVKNLPLAADTFINNVSDLTDYQFKLVFTTESYQSTIFAGRVAPPVTRACNLMLGARVIHDYLVANNYQLAQLTPTEYEFIAPNIVVAPSATEDLTIKEINDRIDTYITTLKTRLQIPDPRASQYDQRRYGKGVNMTELRQQLSDIQNIEQIRNNLIRYHRWKKQEYTSRSLNLKEQFAHDRGVFDAAGLTREEINQLSPQVSNKLTLSYIDSAITCINGKIGQLEQMTATDLQQDYFRALDDPKYGLSTILDTEITDQITNIISSLIRGYQAFSTDFQNIVITGPAGVGKTTMAFILSFVFRQLHILCVGSTKVVTRADLVAAYLGQTAPKTRSILFSSLEGILFIDEAYQVGGCPKEDQFGMESLTELVNFLDKYVGISVIIVAGYEREMNECFFARNEGLRRRFPNKFNLKRYTSIQLLKVFLTKVMQSLQQDIFMNYPDLVAAYLMIDVHQQKNYFPNMGGDMLILAGRFVRYYLASGQIQDSLINAMFEYCLRDKSEQECDNDIDEYLRVYGEVMKQ